MSNREEKNHALLPSNIVATEGRFFINISKRGCGSGCSYCYIDGTHDQQTLLDESEVLDSITIMQKHPDFTPGARGTLVSLCPDTEPCKTVQSTDMVIKLLEHLLPLGNPIQLSSKERIPADLLQLVSTRRRFDGQFVLFVSSSTISRVAAIEPHAAPPAERFANIAASQRYGVLSCLYLKPFLPATLIDLPIYAEVIRDYAPSMICVGVLYSAKESNMPESAASLHHPVHSALGSPGKWESMSTFRTQLVNRFRTPVFFSSVCVSAYARNWFPTPRIWQDYSSLCVNCRSCDSQYQSWQSEVIEK